MEQYVYSYKKRRALKASESRANGHRCCLIIMFKFDFLGISALCALLLICFAATEVAAGTGWRALDVVRIMLKYP